jgi:hypothetical protein
MKEGDKLGELEGIHVPETLRYSRSCQVIEYWKIPGDTVE